MNTKMTYCNKPDHWAEGSRYLQVGARACLPWRREGPYEEAIEARVKELA